MQTLNTYLCVSNPNVQSTVTVKDWLQSIKHSEYSECILQARSGVLDYNQTKRQLPCCTYNFLFNQYKKNDNIIGGTGLLYIDIDDLSFSPTVLNLEKVFSYYNSFGGEGYSLLIKVEGLTLENYNSTFDNIISDLGIKMYVDYAARKATQYNILSYDPTIYINESSFIYSASISNEKSTPSVVNKKKEDIYDTRGAFFQNQLRYDNTDTIQIEGDYIVNWEGYTIVKAWIPMQKVPDGKRYHFFLGYANNLMSLNPHLNFQGLLNAMKGVNPVACFNPIAESQLIKVASAISKQCEAGKLQPIEFNKKRKIVFSKQSQLDKESKLGICRSELAKHRTDGSKNKMYAIIEAWDFAKWDKITQPAMVKHHSISRKTVQKYWSEFKGYIAELNSVLKPAPEVKKVKEKTIMNVQKQQTTKEEYTPELDTLTWYIGDQLYHFGNYNVIKLSVIEEIDIYRLRNQLMSAPYNDEDLIFNGRNYAFTKFKSGNETMILLSA